MTEHFNEVQKCVKNYFDESLLRGLPLISVVDNFKNGPLPIEIKQTCPNVTDQELRRHGQLVGSKYLLREYNQQSATLPDTDPFKL